MKISRKAELATLLSTAILNKDSEPEINPFEGVDDSVTSPPFFIFAMVVMDRIAHLHQPRNHVNLLCSHVL